jgi:ADP-ribose diphosphatase
VPCCAVGCCWYSPPVSNNYWKRLRTATLLEHPRFNIIEDDVLLPEGGEAKYLRFEGQRDYVTILAEHQHRIAVLWEYSYPLDEWLWQFPEGMLRSDEDPVSGAARQLVEETGFTPGHVEVIGMNYGNHRRSRQKNHIVRASGLRQTHKPAGDPEEAGTELHWLTEQDVRDKVISGEIRQKNTLAALGLYLVLLGS